MSSPSCGLLTSGLLCCCVWPPDPTADTAAASLSTTLATTAAWFTNFAMSSTLCAWLSSSSSSSSDTSSSSRFKWCLALECCNSCFARPRRDAFRGGFGCCGGDAATDIRTWASECKAFIICCCRTCPCANTNGCFLSCPPLLPRWSKAPALGAGGATPAGGGGDSCLALAFWSATIFSLRSFTSWVRFTIMPSKLWTSCIKPRTWPFIATSSGMSSKPRHWLHVIKVSKVSTGSKESLPNKCLTGAPTLSTQTRPKA
mmetsp:Transcript_28449/g.80863  ORF Transcript_28449/g.80863 Transcript_28449/m.80863 type:complete len:258 (-) Transcript_28449:865-1638(-)